VRFDHKDDDVVIVDTHIHASCGPVTVDGPSPLFLLHGKRWQGYWGGTETDGIVGGCWGQGEAWDSGGKEISREMRGWPGSRGM
jgi:hypothetical protein